MCGQVHYFGWLLAIAFAIGPAQELLAQEAEGGDGARHGKAPVCCVAFAPNGRFFAVGRDDGVLRLRDVDVERWRVVAEGHRGPIGAIAFDATANNFAFACGAEAAIEVWSNSARDPVRCVHYGVRTLALAPDGRLLVSGGSDQAVRFWELPTGRLLPSVSPHHAEVTSVACTRNGTFVISGAADGGIWLWDTAPPRPRRSLMNSRSGVASVAISADDQTAWAGGQDGTVRGCDVATGQLRGQFNAGASVLSIALSPDGRLAAGTADGTIRLWDLRTAAECAALRGHTQAVVAVAFSPDGKTLVSAGRDGEARIWHLPGGPK